MTEQEWLTSDDIRKMCYFIKDERKLRLFAVACCREVWHYLIAEDSKKAVEVTEQFIDGLIIREEMWTASHRASHVANEVIEYDGVELAHIYAAFAVSHASFYTVNQFSCDYYQRLAVSCANAASYVSFYKSCNLLRNIVNPFHKFTFKPSEQARSFADVIYWNKDWQALIVLADMLEEEGCTDTILLNHLRTKEQFYKGWWSLDAVRGF